MAIHRPSSTSHPTPHSSSPFPSFSSSSITSRSHVHVFSRLFILLLLLSLIILPARCEFSGPVVPPHSSCEQLSVCFVVGPEHLGHVHSSSVAAAEFMGGLAHELAGRYVGTQFAAVGFGGNPRYLPAYEPWVISYATSNTKMFKKRIVPKVRDTYAFATYSLSLCDYLLRHQPAYPRVMVLVHPFRLVKFDYEELLAPFASRYVIASASGTTDLARQFEPYVTRPYPYTTAGGASLSRSWTDTSPTRFELDTVPAVEHACKHTDGPPTYPLPRNQEIVPYILYGQPRFNSPEELPDLSEENSPSDNAKATAQALGFFLLDELRASVAKRGSIPPGISPYSVVVRANVSIVDYVPGIIIPPIDNSTSIFPVDEGSDGESEPKPVPMRMNMNMGMDTEMDKGMGIGIEWSDRMTIPTLVHCPAYKCAVTVRVWSNVNIEEFIIDKAIDLLKQRPGYNQVYINQDTDAQRKWVARNTWDVTFPFQIQYEEEHYR